MMHTIEPNDASFQTFTNILTGYRLSTLLRAAHECGLFTVIGAKGAGLKEVCSQTGWRQNAASRFLHALCATGLLTTRDGIYQPTSFSRTFLLPDSPHYQGRTLTFEKQLVESWGRIEETLEAGRRVYGVEDKNEQELEAAYTTYLGAMDEAARERAPELWDGIAPQEYGTILDIGAGSGRFLKEFLARHPQWQAIFCDLPNVVAKAAGETLLSSFGERIRFLPCNYLDPLQSDMESITDRSCDLVLLSNVVHCQSMEETKGLLQQAAAKTSSKGLLLIHDFFTDTVNLGALYDIHMLLNTYNGRTYSGEELTTQATALGLCHARRRALASGSEFIAFAREKTALQTVL